MRNLIVLTMVLSVPLLLSACSSDGSCIPHDLQVCSDGVMYWADSCGNLEEEIQQCECECNPENTACKTPCDCTPQCAGRCCGSDQCGETCPDNCGAGEQCNTQTCTCETACTPRTCAAQGKECGQWDDGCGRPLDCGPCPEGFLCTSDGLCAVACPGGRTSCADECVDTSADPRHCGSCGNACQVGQLCQDSQCVAGPDCRQEPCTGFTYCDLNNGQCVAGCIEDNQCALNEHCEVTSHSCACDTGTHRCSGACVSNDSPDHCGALCTPCPRDSNGTTTCENQQCVLRCDTGYIMCTDHCVWCNDPMGTPSCGANDECVLTCQTGYHQCADACVTDDHVDHCGTLCTPCPGDPNGTPRCTNGQCDLACNTGYIFCADNCIACSDPNGTPSCGPTGLCQIECDLVYHLCGEACVTNTDTDHCGSSCTPCPDDPNGYPTCDGFSCGIECHAGYIYCGGSCIACSDPFGTPSCSGGQCLITCDSDYHMCAGSCVSDDHPDNCGPLCTPCPDTDPNGDPACINELCSISCHTGYVLCGGGCMVCDDPHGSGSCGAGDQCVITCDPGYHMCSDTCVSDNDVAHCGSSCTPCPTVANGTPYCDGTNCGINCDTGYIYCGGACIPCSDPHGSPSCGASDECVITCDWNYHMCGSLCVSDYDTANCGSACTPCPTDPNGTETCDGFSCGITCDFGYHMCAGACSLCPGTDGVESYGCSAGACIITECQVGWYPCGGVCCQWIVETVDSDRASQPSIAVDSNGIPHISYYKNTTEVWYATWSGGSWLLEQVDSVGLGASSGLTTSIALDSNGVPHIAYKDANNYVRYAVRGTGWVTDQVFSSSKNIDITDRAIAIDQGDDPRIAIRLRRDGSSTYEADIVQLEWDVDQWNTQYVYSTMDNRYSPPTLVINSNDDSHLAWIEFWNDHLMHSYQTSGVWSTDQLTNEAAGVSQTSYIDVDSSDNVLIGFEMFWDLHTLASNLTGSWAYTTVHTELRNNGGLVIGSTDLPHILYTDTGDVLVYAQLTNLGWDYLPIIDFTTGNMSFALHTDDEPHIVLAGSDGIRYIHR